MTRLLTAVALANSCASSRSPREPGRARSHEEKAQDRLRNPIAVRLSIVPCRIEWRELAAEVQNVREESSAVFLTLYWKDNVRHWRFLDGYAHLVHALFEALPPTSTVLDDYARFLYHIGERSLPDAFVLRQLEVAGSVLPDRDV